MHIEFPKFLYSKKEAPKLVHTQEEADKLGSDWKPSPADIDDPEVAIKPGTDPTPQHETTATIPVVTSTEQTVGMATAVIETVPDSADTEDGDNGTKAKKKKQ